MPLGGSGRFLGGRVVVARHSAPPGAGRGKFVLLVPARGIASRVPGAAQRGRGSRVGLRAEMGSAAVHRLLRGEAPVRRAVGQLVTRARDLSLRGQYEDEAAVWADPLWNSLKKDGLTLDENEQLQPMMPQAIDVPAVDDEVHNLLDQLGFATSKG